MTFKLRKTVEVKSDKRIDKNKVIFVTVFSDKTHYRGVVHKELWTTNL